MKILLVDDHMMVREGLRRILADEILGAQFGEAATSSEALALVRVESWDIIMLDLSLPGRSGLESLKDIHAVRRVPVLVMTMYAEEQYALRAFRAGAAGYITKGSSLDELVAAVQKVAGGGKYITANVADQLATSLQAHNMRDSTAPGALPTHDALSDRELQVLRMLGSGKTVKEIGAELALSVKTVSTYRTRILEKMHLRTTAQLVHYAVNARIID